MSGDKNDGQQQEEAFKLSLLEEHNKLRTKYGSVKPLVLDDVLNKLANEHAAYLATKQTKLENSTNDLVGENLYYLHSNDGKYTSKQVIEFWLKRSELVPNVKPTKTSHFTQMIWKSSKKMGVGIGKAQNGAIYICCFYEPRGNVTNYLNHNVIFDSPTTTTSAEKTEKQPIKNNNTENQKQQKQLKQQQQNNHHHNNHHSHPNHHQQNQQQQQIYTNGHSAHNNYHYNNNNNNTHNNNNTQQQKVPTTNAKTNGHISPAKKQATKNPNENESKASPKISNKNISTTTNEKNEKTEKTPPPPSVTKTATPATIAPKTNGNCANGDDHVVDPNIVLALEDLFNLVDKNKSGKVSLTKTKKLFQQINQNFSTCYTSADAKRLFERCQKNEENAIQLDDFKKEFAFIKPTPHLGPYPES